MSNLTRRNFFGVSAVVAGLGITACKKSDSDAGEKNIWEICELSCKESLQFFKQLTITDRQKVIAGPIVKDIVATLHILVNVGLDYLTL